MTGKALSATMLIVAASFPGRAAADMPPPPGVREAQFAMQVMLAGYDCQQVTSFRGIRDSRAGDFDKKGLIAYDVVCANGSKFLVAILPRHGVPPDQRNAPPPLPIVTPVP